MKIEAVMAAALMLFSGTAIAQTQPATDTAAPSATIATSEVKDPDKVRCERIAVTGSRLGGKVCHTEAEWAMIDKRADELMHDIGRAPIGFVGEGQHSLPPTRTSGSLADGL